MKNQRILVALTVVNFGLLAFQLVRARPVQAQGVGTVLRGSGLEIVDERGKVRASIQILPPDPKFKQANGEPSPETVMLRLIDPNGRPQVKLGASVQGAGLGLGGAQDPTYARMKAEGAETELSLKDKDGRERLIKVERP